MRADYGALVRDGAVTIAVDRGAIVGVLVHTYRGADSFPATCRRHSDLVVVEGLPLGWMPEDNDPQLGVVRSRLRVGRVEEQIVHGTVEYTSGSRRWSHPFAMRVFADADELETVLLEAGLRLRAGSRGNRVAGSSLSARGRHEAHGTGSTVTNCSGFGRVWSRDRECGVRCGRARRLRATSYLPSPATAAFARRVVAEIITRSSQHRGRPTRP
jgi:hypothetical protein